MSTGKLSYFGLHGRAGGIRMMLNHGNVAFENNMIAQEDWPALKSTMPGGSMPIW
jgi:glutathione S-transferase